MQYEITINYAINTMISNYVCNMPTYLQEQHSVHIKCHVYLKPWNLYINDILAAVTESIVLLQIFMVEHFQEIHKITESFILKISLQYS